MRCLAARFGTETAWGPLSSARISRRSRIVNSSFDFRFFLGGGWIGARIIDSGMPSWRVVDAAVTAVCNVVMVALALEFFGVFWFRANDAC